MAIYKIIDDITPGDNYELVRTYTVSENLTGATFTVKLERTDPDAYAKIKHEITTVLVATKGQIVNNADGTSTLTFSLQQDDTDELTSQETYVYDIEYETASGKKFTAEHGKVHSGQNVTQV